MSIIRPSMVRRMLVAPSIGSRVCWRPRAEYGCTPMPASWSSVLSVVIAPTPACGPSSGPAGGPRIVSASGEALGPALAAGRPVQVPEGVAQLRQVGPEVGEQALDVCHGVVELP